MSSIFQPCYALLSEMGIDASRPARAQAMLDRTLRLDTDKQGSVEQQVDCQWQIRDWEQNLRNQLRKQVYKNNEYLKPH